MSLSNLVGNTAASLYHSLPVTAGAAGLSAGVSYAVGRLTSRVALSTPLAAAKFTAAVGLLFTMSNICKRRLETSFELTITKANSEQKKTTVVRMLPEKIITVLGLYKINALFNPKNSISSALSLIGLATQCIKLSKKCYQSIGPTFHYTNKTEVDSLLVDGLNVNGLKTLYSELPQTVMATLATGLLCRSLRVLGLDPKTAMIITVATAALRSGKAFFDSFSKLDRSNYLSDILSVAALTYAAKNLSNLDLPGYKVLAKAYVIANATIFAAGFVEKPLEVYSQKLEKLIRNTL